MLFFTAIRWQVATALRTPGTWILLVCVGIAWPSIKILMGLGLTTATQPPQAILWQVGLVATLTGCTLSLYRLCKQGWWAQRTHPALRTILEVGSICALGCIFLVASTLAAGPSEGFRSLGPIWGMGLLASLHAGLLGTLLLTLPTSLPAGIRAGCLPILGWVLPAFVLGTSFPERTLRQTLELARYFEFPLRANSPATLWWTLSSTLIGLAALRLAVLFARTPEPCATPSSETSTPT